MYVSDEHYSDVVLSRLKHHVGKLSVERTLKSLDGYDDADYLEVAVENEILEAQLGYTVAWERSLFEGHFLPNGGQQAKERMARGQHETGTEAGHGLDSEACPDFQQCHFRRLALAGGAHEFEPEPAGKLLGQRRLEDERIMAFALDGGFLGGGTDPDYGGDDGQITLWDMRSGKELWKVECKKRGGVHALAFLPDGRSLATTGHLGNVVLLEVASAKERATLYSVQEDNTALAVSPEVVGLVARDVAGPHRVQDAVGGPRLDAAHQEVRVAAVADRDLADHDGRGPHLDVAVEDGENARVPFHLIADQLSKGVPDRAVQFTEDDLRLGAQVVLLALHQRLARPQDLPAA